MDFGLVEEYEQNNKPDTIINIEEDEQQYQDKVTESIVEKLQVPPIIVPKYNIYRVPKRLLDINYRAYVPQVISIGPFHQDQQVFKATEELKLQFFNSYRCRVDMSIYDIVEKTRRWEKRARQCYSEPTDHIENDDFVRMMVLDGCFIVEFMIMDYGGANFPKSEMMVNSSFYEPIRFDICRDLTILENQLPFFVLQGLFDLVSLPKNTNISFERVVHTFLNQNVLLGCHKAPYDMANFKKPRHLVDFLRLYFVPGKSKNCRRLRKCLPPNATALREAGVIFKKAKRKERHVMDIRFTDGVLEIPSIEIEDDFETYVRNLMAFEQFSEENNEMKSEEGHEEISKESNGENNEMENVECEELDEEIRKKSNGEDNEMESVECDEELDEEISQESNGENNEMYVTDYIEFLDELISSEKDVSLLVKEEIIINSIGGSDQEISKLFNDLCKYITVDEFNHFSNISEDLKKHCEKRWNRWMASLRHNYFNTPWAFISFLAATFIIFLTLLQTIFSSVSISK